MAAIRKFFKHQERRHGVLFNPAAAVEGPRLVVTEGKTRAFPEGTVKRLLESIGVSNVVGQRDRALLATLHWTARRASEVAGLRIRHWFSDGERWLLDFGTKGGKSQCLRVNHSLQFYLQAYADAADFDQPRDRTSLLRIWSTGTGEKLAERSIPFEARSVAFHPAGNELVVAGNGKDVLVLDRNTGRILRTLSVPAPAQPSYFQAYFDAHGDWLAVAGGASGHPGELHLWDWRTGQKKAHLRGHKDRIRFLVFDPAGERMITWANDHSLRAWNVRSATADEPREKSLTLGISTSSVHGSRKPLCSRSCLASVAMICPSAPRS